jgi:hypothetical protein
MTGEVAWRTGGSKKRLQTLKTEPRGENLVGPEAHPSERPRDAASAGARPREIRRQAWSGTLKGKERK